MTVIKRYSENRELIAEDKPINTDTAEQYVAQYGGEYAQGYLQALSDFDVELEALIWKKLGENTKVLSSRTISNTKMMKFHNQKVELIERLKLLGIDLPESKGHLNL